jgi:hypothetical protein
MTGAALTPTVAALWLFGTFFFLILRVPRPSRWASPACPCCSSSPGCRRW